jgi:hypothetical protein
MRYHNNPFKTTVEKSENITSKNCKSWRTTGLKAKFTYLQQKILCARKF